MALEIRHKIFVIFAGSAFALACSGTDDSGAPEGASGMAGLAGDSSLEAGGAGGGGGSSGSPMGRTHSVGSGGQAVFESTTIVSGLVKELDVGWSYVGFEPKPVVGAAICSEFDGDRTCVTIGSDGTYEFEDVPTNVVVTFRVSADGFYPRFQELWTGTSSRRIFDFRMIPGERVDADSGAMQVAGALLVEVGDILSGGFTPREGATFSLDGATPLTTDPEGVFGRRDGAAGVDGLLLFWEMQPGTVVLGEALLSEDCAYVGDEYLSLSAEVEVEAGAISKIIVMCGAGVRDAAR